MNKLISLVKKDLIQLWRDKRTLAVALAIPVIVTFLFGFAYQGTLSHVPIGISDQDNSELSTDLTNRILNSRVVSYTRSANSLEELRQQIEKNIIRAGIFIPEGFEEDIQNNQSTALILVFDGSQPQVVTLVKAELLLLISEMQREILASQGGGLPIELIDQTVFLQNPKTVDIFSFGILGIIVNFLPISLVSTSIAKEKEGGTIESLSVTPVRTTEIIIGKLISFFVVTTWNIFVVLFITINMFGAYNNGSLLDIIVFSIIFLITNLTQGLLISTISPNQLSANQLTFMILIPSIIFSGFLYPVESLHPDFVWIHDLLPLSYFYDGARKIMINGFGLADIIFEIFILSMIGIISSILAIFLFKKGLE